MEFCQTFPDSNKYLIIFSSIYIYSISKFEIILLLFGLDLNHCDGIVVSFNDVKRVLGVRDDHALCVHQSQAYVYITPARS